MPAPHDSPGDVMMWSRRESSTTPSLRLRVKNPLDSDAFGDPCKSALHSPALVCQDRRSSIDDTRAFRDVVKAVEGSTLKSPRTTMW